MLCYGCVILSWFGCFPLIHGGLEVLYKCCFCKEKCVKLDLKANFPKNAILNFSV